MTHVRRMSFRLRYQCPMMSPLVLIVFLSASYAAVLPDDPNRTDPFLQTTTAETELSPTTTATYESEEKSSSSSTEEYDSSEKQPEPPTTSPHFIQEFRQRSHLFTSNFGSNKSQGLHSLGEELMRTLESKHHITTGDKTRNKPRSLYEKILWLPFCNTTTTPPPPPPTTTPTSNPEDEKSSDRYSSPRDKIISHITLVLQKNISAQQRDEDAAKIASGVGRVPFIGHEPYTGNIFVSQQGNIDIIKKESPEKIEKEKMERKKVDDFVSDWLTHHPDLSRYNSPAINFSNPGIGDFLTMLGMGAMLQDITGTNRTRE